MTYYVCVCVCTLRTYMLHTLVHAAHPRTLHAAHPRTLLYSIVEVNNLNGGKFNVSDDISLQYTFYQLQIP